MRTLIFAHRGASKLAPENTMPAFELAYEMGADGIETDVQLTKDGIPVLIHDENVRRTTNGIGFVQDYTLEELQKLDAGSWFSEQYSNTKIITLDEFLNWIQNKDLQINIEIKNNVIDYKNIEIIVNDLINSYHLSKRTIISSFNSNTIKKIHKINKHISTAFLTSQKIKDLPDYTKDLKADSLHIRYRILSKTLVQQSHDKNLKVRVYTVNRPSQMARCFKLGCDAIFTDVPNIAIEHRHLF